MECWTAVIVMFAVVVIYQLRESRRKRAERTALREKLVAWWGEAVADRLLRGEFWQGATVDQVHVALGQPLDIDEKVLKTKTQHTWKYHRVAVNQYALKVFFENGVCVEWEKK